MADIDAGAIQQIIKLGAAEVFTSSLPGGLPSVVVPTGYSVLALPKDEKLADNPQRIKAHSKLCDPASFIKYFTDFRSAGSAIFAEEENGTILAILDYHHYDDTATARPRWCEHKAELKLDHSDEWNLWTGNNQKRMTQEDFARFLEDNSPDLYSPDSATMLEIARGMTAKLEINVDTAIRTNTGATFRYNEIVKAGALGAAGEFSVPDEFSIKIPVYLGTAQVAVRVRLRYQIGAGKLTMWYDLWRHQQTERMAFDAAVSEISESLKIQILNGTPA